MYPNAKENEWKVKNRDGERTLHVLQLRNPNMDYSELWNEKHDATVDNDDESTNAGFLDASHEVLEIPLIHQVYDYIRSTQDKGASEPQIGAYFGQSKLNVRAVIKSLVKTTNIDFYTTIKQRQNIRR